MLRQLRGRDPVAQFLGLGAFLLAQLLLDRLELLAQVVLPLRVGHLLLRLRLDLAFQFEQRDLAAERVGDRLQLHRQLFLVSSSVCLSSAFMSIRLART